MLPHKLMRIQAEHLFSLKHVKEAIDPKYIKRAIVKVGQVYGESEWFISRGRCIDGFELLYDRESVPMRSRKRIPWQNAFRR
ncbi:hypothetical protein JAAARDRAFT_586210 [Jaapia argillacea MUCL 33604]|uniref:Uncharacterized protein n=1 Tax=Jaapia argillacea MUCL 33604 TaxID=933084 RepID=A0A067P618_9AGAM|nr:hypothetical protein JAAARDRAFT_586210 [Jaapia argillacea MUCL 33604]